MIYSGIDEMDSELTLLFSFLGPVVRVMHFFVVIRNDEVISPLLGLGFRLHYLLIVGPFLGHSLPKRIRKRCQTVRGQCRTPKVVKTTSYLVNSAFLLVFEEPGHDVNEKNLPGRSGPMLTVVDEAFHATVSLFLDLGLPLVKEGQWGDYESRLAARIS